MRITPPCQSNRHLSAVAQQLARRPLSKGTMVCFGHRWLQINKMDDTIWIRTWHTPALISFFSPVIYNSVRVRPTCRWWWHCFFFANSNNSIFLHLSMTQSRTVRVSSYLPQNSGSSNTSPILIPFRFIEGLPLVVRQRRPILKSLIPPSLLWLWPCRQHKFNLTIRF